MLNSPEEYLKMSQAETSLWWYKILHEKVLQTIRKNFTNKTDIRILDAGCGSGGMLLHFKKNGYDNGLGVDVSEHAIQFCQQKKLTVIKASLLDLETQLLGEQFDVILSLDVLYFFSKEEQQHILSNFQKMLQPNGIVILNLPANKYFRGEHDLAVGIKKRFTRKAVEEISTFSGLKITSLHYWPFFLSPIILATRTWQRLTTRNTENRKPASDISMPAKFLNSIFYWVCKMEEFWPGKKWGSSMFVILKR